MQSSSHPALRTGPSPRLIFAAAAAGFVILVGLVVYFVDFFPSLSHVNVQLFSGATTGDYYANAARAARAAEAKRGRIENISTNGSMDNLKRLAGEATHGRFALVQNGLPWPDGLELAAQLPTPEVVFFLGRDADRIQSFSDLRGMRIGGGAQGSGTAQLAESIFNLPAIRPLGVQLSYHNAEEQIQMLKDGRLDLGVFVISEKAEFIEKAVAGGLQIASIRQLDSVSRRLPFLKARTLQQGFFDPVRNLPPADKNVLTVGTLLLTNTHARRSEIVGTLTALNEVFPNLINYNRIAVNDTGLPMAAAATDFYTNQGAEVFDRYLPKLMDLIPIANLVQLVMVVSVLFNLMGLGNRFILWRIDANRVAIEEEISTVFGENVLPEEIEIMEPQERHRSGEGLDRLNALIGHLTNLETRCRKQSQSILVPMGAEMAYRYQERLISTNLIAIKKYKARI